METLTLPQIVVNLQPTDKSHFAQARLPEPWEQLKSRGFHPDLLERAQSFYFLTEKFSALFPFATDNTEHVLSVLGEGFLNPFDPEPFAPKAGDSFKTIKEQVLAALVELSETFGDRVSSIFWDSFAYLATREEPETEATILSEANSSVLPSHYTIVDSCLHASGLVYSFLQHVNSVVYKHSGRVLDHNCDCSCSLINLVELDGSINLLIPDAKVDKVTQSLFSHFLCETPKLQWLGMPFALGLSEEYLQVLREEQGR